MIIDLFSGCGGLSSGFVKAGFKVACAVDMWKDATETFKQNHKDVKFVFNCSTEKFIKNEICSIKNNFKIDGVVGGPPCQGFSTVGTRDPSDKRNHLFKDFYQIVQIVSPNFFLIENVQGLLNLNKGYFIKKIVELFGEDGLGYNINYKLINTSEYGIPQVRKRVFIVGTKNKFFHFPTIEEKRVSTSEALSDLPSLDFFEKKSKYKFSPQNEYQEYLRINSSQVLNHEPTKHTQQTIDVISRIKDGGKISDLPKEFWEIRKYNKTFQRMNSSKPSLTIDTGHRNYFHYKENRIPSVRECARIQSFDDTFEFLSSKTSQYKQVGNAVPPIMANKIALNLKKEKLYEKPEKSDQLNLLV